MIEYISGVQDKYPAQLLADRPGIECSIIGAIYAEPSILVDDSVHSDDFITIDAQFLFSMAEMLVRQYHLNELTEGSIKTHATEQMIKELEARGGYRMIHELKQMSTTKNIFVELDNLAKSNLILKLYSSGFPVLRPIDDGSGNTVIPFNEFKKLDCQGTSDWFDTVLLRFAKDKGCTSKIIDSTRSFEITDDLIESFIEGDKLGTNFGYFGDYEDGTPDMSDKDPITGNSKKISTFPFLCDEIKGFRHGTTNALCGYSSTGKSMLMCEILLGLISNGEKVCIISNEMDKNAYYLSFITFLAARKFRYYGLTRSKMQSGNLNPEDKAYLKRIAGYFNDRFAPNIAFYHIADADMQLVKRTIRRTISENESTVVFYDTMKADISDYTSSEPAYLSLIRDSRILDEMAKRYDLINLVTIQISSSTKGRLWIDESCISQSKQIIEIMETCLMLRNLYPKTEADMTSKDYINPYQKKAVEGAGAYIPQPYGDKFQEGISAGKNYSLLFITKNRAGENSERNGEVLLLQADTAHSIFHEVAWARPTRGVAGLSPTR